MLNIDGIPEGASGIYTWIIGNKKRSRFPGSAINI